MIKRILKSVREYKIFMILTPILVILEVMAETYIPFLVADLIDLGINCGNMAVIKTMSIKLILTAIFSLIVGVLAGMTAVIGSNGFAKNLRHDIFYRAQSFSFQNIDKFSTAGIVTRLTTDVTRVQQAYQMSTRMAFRAPIMLFFAIMFSYKLNRQLSAIFLILVPILLIGFGLIVKFALPYVEKAFAVYDELNRDVEENLHGMRVVKSFVREDYEKLKFKKISAKIYELYTKSDCLTMLSKPLMMLSTYTCTLLISWFGAKLIVASGNNSAFGMTTGSLMSFLTYSMQILMSLMMLTMVVVMMIMSQASAKRIDQILKEENTITNPQNPATDVKNGEIEFKDVSFSYHGKDGKRHLKDINLKINSGETVGILGGTGSSKTTLVQLIPRLYDVTDGAVYVGGRDVREYDINSLRDNVSMVLQKNELFSGTIAENLRWGNVNATDEELKKACDMAQATEFIDRMPKGIETKISQGGTNVSGGQKQRLCIARAILKNPKIIIFDDSTSAVDTKTDALIQKAMYESMPTTTKLIIAQRISSIEHADKIVVMDNGKISGIGTHSELLQNNDIYREVYTSQMKGGDENE